MKLRITNLFLRLFVSPLISRMRACSSAELTPGKNERFVREHTPHSFWNLVAMLPQSLHRIVLTKSPPESAYLLYAKQIPKANLPVYQPEFRQGCQEDVG